MRETKQDKQPLFLGKHTPGEDQREGERAKEKTNYRRLQEKNIMGRNPANGRK